MPFSRKNFLYLFAALIAGWAIYCYNPFQLYFQNDDFTHILLSKKGVLFQRNSFRPVCDLSIMLDYYLWGKNATGYHITNIILHCICTGLVFVFAKEIISLYYPGCNKYVLAMLTGALFFLYPLHSEAVFWILGRSAILGAIFSLLFLIAFLKEDKSAFGTALCYVFYVLALLAYESSWVLPLVAVVLMTHGDKTKTAKVRSIIGHSIALGLIFLIYLFFRWKTNNEILGVYEGANFIHFNAGILLQNFLRLFARSFASYRQTNFILILAFILLSAGIFYFFAKQIKQHLTRTGYIFICFLISLLPYLSLGIDTNGTEGERFLYLPSVFVCLFISVVILQIQKRYARFVFGSLFIIVYAIQLGINATNYRFAGSVVKQTFAEIAKSPDNKNIIIYGLPKSQHGALILTHGLEDGWEFFQLNKKAVSIKVASQRSELSPLQTNYNTIYMPGNIDSVIRYNFTDSALLIYK